VPQREVGPDRGHVLERVTRHAVAWGNLRPSGRRMAVGVMWETRNLAGLRAFDESRWRERASRGELNIGGACLERRPATTVHV
jgi:hypothetical protein